MDNLRYDCKECSCKLWSDYSRKLGVCPECKDPDKDAQDLESMLDSILDQTKG